MRILEIGIENVRGLPDLHLKPNADTLVIWGPNGAGKSTIIKMLMGVLNPTAGNVRVLGRDVCDEPEEIRQRVGYVPEMHFMVPTLDPSDFDFIP